MAFVPNAARDAGPTAHHPSKMVSSKMAVRNNEKNTISNNNNNNINNAARQPLHVIAVNVAAKRVQPPRQAKKNQKTTTTTTTSFDIFVDEKLERNKQNAGQTKVVAVDRDICIPSVIVPGAAAAVTSAATSAAADYIAPRLEPTATAPVTCRMDIDEEFEDDVSMDVGDEESSILQVASSAETAEELYAEDAYRYLAEREEKNKPKPRYMAKQTDINHSMRSILVDWLVEVCDELQLDSETLYIAVNLIDRFLSKMSVLRGKLQLVGAAALFVASKYEEIYPPGVKEFIYLTDDAYTAAQLFRMEDLLLRVLHYDVSCPSPSFFLARINEAAASDDTTKALSQYLVHLAMTKGEFYISHLPSVISASAVCVAKHTLGHQPWTDASEALTGYAKKDLQACARGLCDIMATAATSQHQAVREKFSNARYLEVAHLNPPSIYPF